MELSHNILVTYLLKMAIYLLASVFDFYPTKDVPNQMDLYYLRFLLTSDEFLHRFYSVQF